MVAGEVAVSDARRAILAAARRSLADRPVPPVVPREYRHDEGSAADVQRLFAERVADYRAEVRVVAEDVVAEAVAEILRGIGAASVVVPPGLPTSWLPSDLLGVRHDEPPLSPAELDAVDAVVTGCALAIAETGTIVLDGGPSQGRRALTLVPDVHICVVPASSVVAAVPAAVARLDPRRPLTWISGPSATSDIELDRVEGVHGPRHLFMIIIEDAPHARGGG
jgi:L-lactate dehydrogenase complex protein LldG